MTSQIRIHSQRTLAGRILMILGFLSAMFAGSISLAQQATPKATVETTVNAILAILRKPDFNLERDGSGITAAIKSAFDPVATAQSVLSTNWRQATPEQQAEFQDLMLKVLEHTYLHRIQAYTNETVEFKGEEIEGNRATVTSNIMTASGPIPVNYKLRLKDGLWYAYDVEVENVSMVATYRETYRSIVSKSGIDGLLTQMRQQLTQPIPEPASTPPAA